ncbi:MAG: hypothetical protein GY870_07515, partial [archaeon]|nr:hypothetical protein [archaeon]
MSESKQDQENKCLMLFVCNHTTLDRCVYFTGKMKCKYCDGEFDKCMSIVAQVNIIT